MKKLLIFLTTVIIAFSLLGCSLTGDSGNSHDQERSEKTSLKDMTEEKKKNAGTEGNPQEDTIDVTNKSEGTEEKPQEDVPEGHKEALKVGLDYLKFIPHSYLGLIDQLEYEGFTTEEATYAADHCGADWREQAMRAAAEYVKYGSPSYELLIKMLVESDDFLPEDAVYAADNCGADWFQEAAEYTKEYLESRSSTKEEMIEILEARFFTHEQAVYGAEQNGL